MWGHPIIDTKHVTMYFSKTDTKVKINTAIDVFKTLLIRKKCLH